MGLVDSSMDYKHYWRTRMSTLLISKTKMSCYLEDNKCALPIIGAVIFTAEYAIVLFVCVLLLNQEFENVQLLIQIKTNGIPTTSPPGCICPEQSDAPVVPFGPPPEDIKVARGSLEKASQQQPMNMDPNSARARARNEQGDRRRTAETCCDIGLHALKKHVKDFMRSHRHSRSVTTFKRSAHLLSHASLRKRKSSVLYATVDESGLYEDKEENDTMIDESMRSICGTHLIGQFNKEFTKGYGEFKTLKEWTADSQGAYLENLHYNNNDGQIRVTISGFYYIYCQLHYIQTRKVSAEESPEFQMARRGFKIRHKVVKRNHQRDIRSTILSSEITSDENQPYAIYSVFESKVVYLTKGDVVFVKAYVPDSSNCHYMISSDHDRTYFGLLLLTEWSEL